ncbi:HNH endonuclease [Pseudomonas indica]|uniref:HNH endonuclease n=1 Tax=Pseudomonas indica TaxID=137658 RepID=A0A1G9HDP9_9PSED|nr:HNH endonuclease [Pseudomonas indica]SDL10982.1 hypothetical protein SAMN05216186_1156 [Pseudomonas indica]
MAAADKFKQPVITTLAKRAANRCSNPECGAITSGPTDNPDESINIGEAAHIYGANPGSARYDPSMTGVERSAISNAIWLCGNCHKLVDDDPNKYPAGLLFEWQREHERRISEQVEKSGNALRERYEQRHLEEFGRLSYLAERLILEKGDYWEYQLTAEVLRYELAPTVKRWTALKRGLYVKPVIRVENESFIHWLSDRMNEIQGITHAFSELTNSELTRAWGEPGIPGNDINIVTTCRLYAEICNSTLSWEETVRFARTSEEFSSVQNLLIGIAGKIIEECAKIPEFLINMINEKPTTGLFRLSLSLTLPDDWSEKISKAMEQALFATRFS